MPKPPSALTRSRRLDHTTLSESGHQHLVKLRAGRKADVAPGASVNQLVDDKAGRDDLLRQYLGGQTRHSDFSGQALHACAFADAAYAACSAGER